MELPAKVTLIPCMMLRAFERSPKSSPIVDGWPTFSESFSIFPRFDTAGAPSLRFLQGRVRCCRYHELLCPHACIALTARITCTLSRVPVTGGCHFSTPRDRFLSILEQTRQRYRFVVVGYVVMPEHIHLLLTEPETGSPSTVMQVLKQRTARALLPTRRRRDPRQCGLFEAEPRAFWQARFYDFNVWTTKKRFEKVALHAPQSGKARISRCSGTMALE
jgi:REP element-mobilizing transposase RayT